MPTILHLVPKLPPDVCGVGDYAMVIGQRMSEIDPSVRCDYLAIGPKAFTSSSDRLSPELFWQRIEERCMGTSVDKPSIVLHYSGYGYSPDGAPAWLAESLDCRSPWARDVSTVTFFHELYANGWPWQRVYWKSSLQRRIATVIAKASDSILTNREESATWLERATNRPIGTIKHLPVPSNIGEPSIIPAYFARPLQAVIFGNARHKARLMRGHSATSIAALCNKIGITRIVNIGSRIEIDKKKFADSGIEVVHLGFLDSREASDEFLRSRCGFFDYFPNSLSKSGSLAAMASHGVAVIPSRRITQGLDALLNYSHDPVLASMNERSSASEYEKALAYRAEAALNWYRTHDTQTHAFAVNAEINNIGRLRKR